MKYIALLCVGLFLLLTSCAQSEVETAEEENTNEFYELRVYKAEPGKLDDLNTRFRDHTMEIFEKHGMKNIGYWVPIENTDNLLYYVLSYPSREARDASWQAFGSDPAWIEAKNASEVDGSLVAGVESLFLKTTDYSPVVTPSVADNPRTFELRTYTSTPGNLNNLHTRFRDHTIDLFSKHGMEHFGYWSPVEADQGADNTLVYFVFHKDVESRDASFDAFRTDPDWTAAFEASVENAGGSLAENVESILMKPTDYSPTK
ncbi:MAG: NIPSNAP family protein [Balneolales bacterium]